MLIELALGGALLYCADKSNKIDQQSLAKRSKAFTKESEANNLVNQKKQNAEKRLQIVVKRKRAVIEATLPKFVEVYQQIQKIELNISDKKDLAVYHNFDEKNTIQAVKIVTSKPLTDQQLICEFIFKGIGGMMISDSKRNLSAANNQMSKANVIYSQAQSMAEIYDAIAGRADRISRLIMQMNALFIGSVSETEKIINKNGLNVRAYSDYDKGIIMTCVNIASAMSDIINIPVLDTDGKLCESAVEMIQTGEDYLARMNKIIN